MVEVSDDFRRGYDASPGEIADVRRQMDGWKLSKFWDFSSQALLKFISRNCASKGELAALRDSVQKTEMECARLRNGLHGLTTEAAAHGLRLRTLETKTGAAYPASLSAKVVP